jgi:peroxiredoxin
MKHILIALLFSTSAFAAKVGAPAPAFELKDMNGKMVKLSDFAGKTVVLEWFNAECPFVKKHYESKNMQSIQEEYTKKGVVWLVVNSSAKGKQGHLDEASAKDIQAKWKIVASNILLDPTGATGKAYGAKTTPHMYIVDGKGTLVYNGAIDSNPSTDAADIPTSKNFVKMGLTEVLAGKPITNASNAPYGCSVKY